MRVSHALANWAVREWLVDRAVRLFADKAKGFGDAQIGLQDLRVTERDHLTAGVEMLSKTRKHRIRVRRDGRIMLVVILERERMRWNSDSNRGRRRLDGPGIMPFLEPRHLPETLQSAPTGLPDLSCTGLG